MFGGQGRGRPGDSRQMVMRCSGAFPAHWRCCQDLGPSVQDPQLNHAEKMARVAARLRARYVVEEVSADTDLLYQLCGFVISCIWLCILVLGGAAVGVSSRFISRGLERIRVKSNNVRRKLFF